MVLPTYNRAHTVRRAIDSVLSQSYEDFELIVVDDGSTDDTPAVLNSVSDDRVQSLRFPENRGANVARNAGIREADGEYIAFQDSDDIWRPSKLELQVAALDQAGESVGVVYTGYYRVYDGRKKYGPRGKETLAGDIHDELLKGNGWFIPTAVTAVRQTCFETVGLFDERLQRLQDWEMWLRLSERYTFEFINKPLIEKHMRQDEVSIRSDTAAFIDAMELILSEYQAKFQARTGRLAQHQRQLGYHYLRDGRHLRGRLYFLRALRNDCSVVSVAAALAGMAGPGNYRRIKEARRLVNGILS
ncbi:MAG: glycosyltransferase family 2 protein [Halorubrum sp.]|uniref:glycosyltransferase family 2 protein n=1 Tax=Halorubrum sp. TaxID=1879286 RepID=UPI0039710DF3